MLAVLRIAPIGAGLRLSIVYINMSTHCDRIAQVFAVQIMLNKQKTTQKFLHIASLREFIISGYLYKQKEFVVNYFKIHTCML